MRVSIRLPSEPRETLWWMCVAAAILGCSGSASGATTNRARARTSDDQRAHQAESDEAQRVAAERVAAERVEDDTESPLPTTNPELPHTEGPSGRAADAAMIAPGTISVVSVENQPEASMWEGCTASVDAGVSCPDHYGDGPCVELRQGDLFPNEPGNERVLGCGHFFNCDGIAPNAYPVVLVANGSRALAAIGTSEDASCGSVARVQARTLRLEGGGEDGTYVVRYRWVEGEFRNLTYPR